MSGIKYEQTTIFWHRRVFFFHIQNVLKCILVSGKNSKIKGINYNLADFYAVILFYFGWFLSSNKNAYPGNICDKTSSLLVDVSCYHNDLISYFILIKSQVSLTTKQLVNVYVCQTYLFAT